MTTQAYAADPQLQAFEFLEPDSGKVLIKGTERLTQVDGYIEKHTEYFNAQGELTQVEDARYEARTLALAYYHFVDQGTGEMADVRVAAGQAKVQYRETAKETPKAQAINWGESSLSGKAIPDILTKHWDELMRGEAVTFDLYVPFRLETIGFRAVKAEVAKQLKGAAQPITFRIEPSNWFIRQVAPTIWFTYETGAGSPQLLRYEGPSMVDIAGQKNRLVEIVFH